MSCENEMLVHRQLCKLEWIRALIRNSRDLAERSARVASGALLAGVLLAGCSSQTGYEKAFSQKTALSQNSHSFAATVDQTFRAAKVSLVQQGFAIQQADTGTGLLKGIRTLDDPKDSKIAYLITASVDITGSPAGDSSIVTVAANQQTILHKDSTKYYKFLGLVPIPTGKDYQTIVRAEGDITGAGFYQDFFGALERNMPPKPQLAASPSSFVTQPLPSNDNVTRTADASAAPPVPSQVAPVDAAPSSNDATAPATP